MQWTQGKVDHTYGDLIEVTIVSPKREQATSKYPIYDQRIAPLGTMCMDYVASSIFEEKADLPLNSVAGARGGNGGTSLVSENLSGLANNSGLNMNNNYQNEAEQETEAEGYQENSSVSHNSQQDI